MFKHILVPVDGSATSMLAVNKAAGLAKAFGSVVTVLYVVDPYPFTGVGADFAYGQAQYLSAATAEANAALDAAKAAMAQEGITAAGRVITSNSAFCTVPEAARASIGKSSQLSVELTTFTSIWDSTPPGTSWVSVTRNCRPPISCSGTRTSVAPCALTT